MSETPGDPTPQYAPNWYPDPWGRHEHRYYDGANWTEHVSSHGWPSVDPPGGVANVPTVNRPTDKIQTEKDFRRIVERKDIDAVIVGTPDHWHAYVLIAACANNKDVYCEKPLSHNIVEGRAMVNAARRNRRVVQIGTHQRSGRHFQDAVQYVQSGKLGSVQLCRTWITNRSPANEAANSGPPRAHFHQRQARATRDTHKSEPGTILSKFSQSKRMPRST